MRVQVILRGRITVEPQFEGEAIDIESCLDEVFERITDDLYAQQAQEPLVSGSLATGELEVSVDVDAETRGAAVDTGEATIRAALHAAEVATPEWETDRDHLIRVKICEVAAAEATDTPDEALVDA